MTVKAYLNRISHYIGVMKNTWEGQQEFEKADLDWHFTKILMHLVVSSPS